MSNKYSEGYPGARYYGGNEQIDKVRREELRDSRLDRHRIRRRRRLRDELPTFSAVENTTSLLAPHCPRLVTCSRFLTGIGVSKTF